MSSSTSLSRRLNQLEAMQPDDDRRAVLWFAGQSLADALSASGLTLDDDVLAIRILGHGAPPCPLHERDLRLLS